QLLLDDYSGDLRKLRDAAETTRQVSNRLQQFPGIGPTGAAIFLREVQGIWPDIGPYFDKKAMQGAQKVDLPTDAGELAELVDVQDLPRLAAGLVRIALDKSEDPLDQEPCLPQCFYPVIVCHSTISNRKGNVVAVSEEIH